MRSMQAADEHLISIRQMTATVKGTHELVFSYIGPSDIAAANIIEEH